MRLLNKINEEYNTPEKTHTKTCSHCNNTFESIWSHEIIPESICICPVCHEIELNKFLSIEGE
jgi:hypothetical protein